MAREQLEKGYRTEELLREHFLKSGYFAVRGVPFTYADTDVTDLDLWLYVRPSLLGRERVNVDAKDRGKPRAMERILWAKGTQAVLGLERCVVATTDKRAVVKEFGDKHGVVVLDGSFLGWLETNSGNWNEDRLVEEEFFLAIVADSEDRLLGDWKGRYRNAKSRLITSLDFDGCNGWLEDARYFINQALTSGRREAACRLVYVNLSFLLLGLDYSMRAMSFEMQDVRRRVLEEGFRYGNEGKANLNRAVRLATNLLDNYAPEASALGAQIRFRLREEFEELPANILAEYFNRREVGKDLFNSARNLEQRAFARVLVPPRALDTQTQGLIGAVLDYFGTDRERFFSLL